MPEYTVDTPIDDVLTVRITNSGTGWKQRFLLISDIHIDNPHCDRALLTEHLNKAREDGAGILIFGDLLDVMQGREDRRHSKSDLMTEHKSGAYFSDVVNDAAAFLAPYADHIVLISDGNHETAVRKKHEIDLLDFVAQRIGVPKMGYSGFVRFQFHHANNGASGKGTRTSRNLFFHHGSGGGGPVTKGVIRTNRQAVWLPDADIVVGGHIHEAWTMEIPRVRLTAQGRVIQDTQTHVQLATYKQEHTLSGGWHIERGAPPKPLGGQWLEFFYRRRSHGRVGYRIIRAD